MLLAPHDNAIMSVRRRQGESRRALQTLRLLPGMAGLGETDTSSIRRTWATCSRFSTATTWSFRTTGRLHGIAAWSAALQQGVLRCNTECCFATSARQL